MASQYVVRVIVTRSTDIAATGYFQAAWSISMFYLGFALNAMGTDYYPRLSALANDRTASNGLINDQLQVAMTLTGPAMLGMLIFAPQVVQLLFTSAFGQTVEILRLQLVGDIFKIASWPLAFLLAAKGYGKHFFALECFWNIMYLTIIWFGLPLWGINSTGIAFFAAYAIYFVVTWYLIRRMNGFEFNQVNKKLLMIYVASVLTTYGIVRSGGWLAYGSALVLMAIVTYASLSWLSTSMGGLSWSKITKRS